MHIHIVVPLHVATLEGTFFVACMIDIPAQANRSMYLSSLTCGTYMGGLQS